MPAVTTVYEGAELVHREEVLDAIAELLRHVPCVIREGFGRVARLPAAFILKCLRQFPVVERWKRRDAGCDEFVYESVVEVQPLRVGCADAFGENSRPSDGKPVRHRAEVFHQLYVFLIPMVMIVSDVTGRPVPDVAWRVRVRIPDRLPFAIFIGRTFDLVRRRSDAPIETLRESNLVVHIYLTVVVTEKVVECCDFDT